MRAPGIGVARVATLGVVRDAGGGVYHAFIAAASFGQPAGNHGKNMFVVRW